MRKNFNLNVNVSMTVDGMREFKEALKVLARTEVLVGVPDTKADRRKKEKTPITNASLAFIHNYGSPSQNIPARPFMEPGIEDGRKPITNKLLQAGKMVLDGKNPEPALHAAGLVAQNAVRNRIQTGPFVPLAPRTLAARRRRGRTGEKPLLDTAQMRNAISYVVRKKP